MKYTLKKPDIVMKHSEFVKEHVKLIDILRNGTRAELDEMAEDQEDECEKYFTKEEMRLLEEDD